MTHTLTLIANPEKQKLDASHAAMAVSCLPAAGDPEWLSDHESCEIGFAPDSEADFIQASESVKHAFSTMPIDIVSQPANKRRKKLLIADMDSTLIGQECIDELADYAGLKPKVAAITERAMRGEIEFEPALRERVALLKGLEETVLQSVFDERITLMPGARTLARTMSANGATTVIVSGGFTFFTQRVAQAAGFHQSHANVLEISDGKLSGTVKKPILGQQTKLDALRSYRDKLSLDHTETLAVGDGANDLAMITEAGLGVAFRAKPIVAEKASASITHGDLTALLFAQGYSRAEFVED